MKFLLINPTSEFWRVQESGMPESRTRPFRYSMLSSLSVAAAMPGGVSVRILDEETEYLSFNEEADLVGLSFMTFNAPRAYDIADRFRARGTPVVMGGYHPTFLPEEATSHADAVCIGEAETTVPELIHDFRYGGMKPFYRGAPADLSILRPVDRGLLRAASYAPLDAVQATRGCPYRCQFCSVAAFFHSQFRTRPVADVIEEIAPLRRYLLFMDDNIAADPDYAGELFSRMIPLRKHWFSQCGLRIAYDNRLLTLAEKSGCRGLFIGFETVSQDGLRQWGKAINRVRDYELAARKIHQHGIGICAGIVLGNDTDDGTIFERTLNFLKQVKIDALQATIMTPFPGTPLYDQMEKAGRIFDRRWDQYDFRNVVFEPLHMSRRTLKDGHNWLLRQFYSRFSIAQRTLAQLFSLKPSSVLKTALPLNLAYRIRLRTDGTL